MSKTPPTEPNTPPDPSNPSDISGRDAYNVVADTVTGVNVRWKDNLFQAVAILVCLVLGVVIGVLVAEDTYMGLFAGGFIGLLVGLFGSGFFLMIFRAVRHARGKHQ